MARKGQTSRVAGAKAGPEATRDTYARPLAKPALELLSSFFASREELFSFLSSVADELPESSYQGFDTADYVDASEVLRVWQTRSDYLDEKGDPKQLPLKGKVSFASLVRESCANLSESAALSALTAGRAVQVSAGSVELVSRVEIVQGRHTAAHARAAVVLARLARTLLGNISDDPTAIKRFERVVLANGLRADQIPAISAYVSRHGQHFLEELDDWLCNRVEESSAAGNVSAGIELFLFTEESPSQKPP